MRFLAWHAILLLILASGAVQPAAAAGNSSTIPQCGQNEGGMDEVICVKGECPAGDISINGTCMNRGFLDFLCGFMDCDGSGSLPETPDVPPGGGAGDSKPPVPTLEQCQEAYRACETDAMTTGREQCEIDRGRRAALLALDGETCFGDAHAVWEDLETFIPGFPPGAKICRRSMLEGEDFVSRACTGAFFLEALTQCVRGRPDMTTALPSGNATVTFSLGKFASLGFGANSGSVSFNHPGGAGFTSICTAAAQKFADEHCARLRSECQAAAQGASGLIIAQPTVEDLLARIDPERLGLAGAGGGPGGGIIGGGEAAGDPLTLFRGLQQGRGELDPLYLRRLDFLGDWSDFLSRLALSPATQRSTERAMQRSQRAVSNAFENWISLIISIWLPDPDTRRLGTPVAQELFRSFVEGDAFERQTLMAEERLFEELEATLGPAASADFRATVWPGIHTFGAARPMREITVVAPN